MNVRPAPSSRTYTGVVQPMIGLKCFAQANSTHHDLLLYGVFCNKMYNKSATICCGLLICCTGSQSQLVITPRRSEDSIVFS